MLTLLWLGVWTEELLRSLPTNFYLILIFRKWSAIAILPQIYWEYGYNWRLFLLPVILPFYAFVSLCSLFKIITFLVPLWKKKSVNFYSAFQSNTELYILWNGFSSRKKEKSCQFRSKMCLQKWWEMVVIFTIHSPSSLYFWDFSHFCTALHLGLKQPSCCRIGKLNLYIYLFSSIWKWVSEKLECWL